MEHFLALFLATVACSVVLNVILRRFDIPTIIGYIFTGIIVNKIFLIQYTDQWAHIAEFGIVFLMFTIGLEFSIKHLWIMKTDVFINGILQVSITGLIFTLIIQYAFDIGQQSAIIIGFALTLSSTAIVLKILNDNGDIGQVYGRKTLGMLLFQDIAVIPLLLMIDIFNSKNSSIGELLGTTFISATILIFLLFVIGRYVFSRVLYFVVKTNSQEIFIATVLFTVIGSGFLASFMGFSHTLGSFLAGMLLAETTYKQQIEADLIPFRDLLLGLFFITVGMQIDFSVIINNIVMVIIVLIDVMIIKALVVYFILVIKQKKRIALKTSLAICQIGEFALAIFSILSANKMLDIQTAQILTTSVIISMVFTPFILKNVNKIADKLEVPADELNMADLKVKLDEYIDHFLVCGYGQLGQEIVQRLKSQGLPYLVIENDMNMVKLGRSRGENVYFGNATAENTLESAGINKCAAVIIAINNEHKLDLVISAIQNIDVKVNVVMKYSGLEKQLYIQSNFHAIKEEKAIARVFVHEALQCKLVEKD